MPTKTGPHTRALAVCVSEWDALLDEGRGATTSHSVLGLGITSMLWRCFQVAALHSFQDCLSSTAPLLLNPAAQPSFLLLLIGFPPISTSDPHRPATTWDHCLPSSAIPLGSRVLSAMLPVQHQSNLLSGYRSLTEPQDTFFNRNWWSRPPSTVTCFHVTQILWNLTQ